MNAFLMLLLQVLFLVDPIDEVAIQNLKSYKEKDFVDISKEDLDLGQDSEILDILKFKFYLRSSGFLLCLSHFTVFSAVIF